MIKLWIGFGSLDLPTLEDGIPSEVQKCGEIRKDGLIFERIFDPETESIIGFGVNILREINLSPKARPVIYGTLLEHETLAKVIAEYVPKIQAVFDKLGIETSALPHILGYKG